MEDMSPETVKKLILDTDITLSELSVTNGFNPAAVSIALRKKAPFVQEIIAARIGKTPQEIWPSRYDENGSPVRHDSRGRRFGQHADRYAPEVPKDAA